MAGKCSIHVEKVKIIGGLDNHNNRKKIKDDAKPFIDKNRTQLNYDLIECKDYNKAIQNRIKSAGLTRKIRTDSALAGSFVINAPTKDNDFINQAFFYDCLNFISKLVGKDNVIAAKVHNDEKTPHLHLVFVPIIEKPNKKNELVKVLSYSDFFGKKKQLQDLQTNFYLEVGQKYKLARGVPSDKKHISTREYRAEKKRVEKINELEKENEKLENLNNLIKNEVKSARKFFADLDELGKDNQELQKKHGGFFGWTKKMLWNNFKNARLAGKMLADKITDFEKAVEVAENKALERENTAKNQVLEAENKAKKATQRADFLEKNFKSEIEKEVNKQLKDLVDEKTRSLNNDLSFLNKRNAELKTEIKELKTEIKELETENGELIDKLNVWEKDWFNADYLYKRVQFLDELEKNKTQKKSSSMKH